MTILEELKNQWAEDNKLLESKKEYDQESLAKIVKSRVRKHTSYSMRYFWASFCLQILVYALLSHVIVRYWPDPSTVLLSLVGIILFIPFTFILMKKFKAMAITKPTDNSGASLFQYLTRHHELLAGFYRFKRRYELVLIPLSTIIGVFLTFKLYVPGGVQAHFQGALITLVITLISCIWSIWRENKRSFERPLHQLKEILKEFESEQGK